MNDCGLYRLKRYFEKMWLDIPGLDDPPKEESVFRTVVHGDAHVNNIKYQIYCTQKINWLTGQLVNMMFSSKDPDAEELR